MENRYCAHFLTSSENKTKLYQGRPKRRALAAHKVYLFGLIHRLYGECTAVIKAASQPALQSLPPKMHLPSGADAVVIRLGDATEPGFTFNHVSIKISQICGSGGCMSFVARATGSTTDAVDSRLALPIEKVRSGTRIDSADAKLLYESAPLLLLAGLADEIRRRHHPESLVTYLIDRNINYTNVCNTDCSFCAFYRHDPKDPEAYVQSRESIGRKIEEALENGATRILFQGGHNDELPYEYYPQIISWIHTSYPQIEINGFSPSEVQQMAKISGLTYEQVLKDLKDAGLRGLPGGGAEILDDEIRGRVSPKKIKADEWIEVMEVAQSLDLTTTVSMVIGFGENINHRLNHLARVRALQDRSQANGHAGFNAFISWTLQSNENTSLGRSRLRDSYGADSVEYLRTVAVARIFLDNVINHQSSWPTLGGEIAKLALHFGANDIGSTMMEENVVSQAGAPSADKWSMTAEELQRLIREAGFTPAQRDSSFKVLRVHNEC